MERFRRLLPDPAAGLDAAHVASAAFGGDGAAAAMPRPFVALNMIATADGRATIAGRTAPIANRADYELFHALRERAGAVLVGAGTVRAEGYGPYVREADIATALAACVPSTASHRWSARAALTSTGRSCRAASSTNCTS
jgi:riboflavin biosynthesis pyrimidine reductase